MLVLTIVEPEVVGHTLPGFGDRLAGFQVHCSGQLIPDTLLRIFS
jgi:hypothetical protein